MKGIPSGACSIKAKARRFITLIIFFGFGIPLWQCIFIFEFVNFCEDIVNNRETANYKSSIGARSARQ